MTLPDRMFGVVLTGHGGPEMLEWRNDLPVPLPGKGEVTVKVGAAGVNNTDINTRVGWYSKSGGSAHDAGWTGAPLVFPRIQGIDVCGRIAAVGEGVGVGRIGERVVIEPCLREANGAALTSPWFLGSEIDGGFAQFTRVASRHAHAIESDMTDVELASFPCSYSTAENLLTRARVQKDEAVLVTGASGGVGSAVVQLARARGAIVVAVTTASKAQSLVELGAAKTLERDEDFVAKMGANSVDAVIDLVAGPKWPTLLELLRPGGRYAVAGAIAGPLVELDVRTLYLKDLSLFGCTMLDAGVFSSLVSRIERKEVVPLVARTYPLHDIVTAQKVFGEKGHVGKIVLEIG